MKFVLSSVLLTAMTFALTAKASDYVCRADQSQQQVLSNTAALLSRAYLATGNKYGHGVGGLLPGQRSSIYTESVWITEKIKLVHTVVSGDGGGENFTVETRDQQFIQALQEADAQYANALSMEDASSLKNCIELL